MSDVRITFNLNFGAAGSEQAADPKPVMYGQINIPISHPAPNGTVPCTGFVADGWVSDPNAGMTATLSCTGPTPPQLIVHIDKNKTDGDGDYYWYTDPVTLTCGLKYCLMVNASDILAQSSGSNTVFFSTAASS